jgi:outer membrane protein assembly factor BamB
MATNWSYYRHDLQHTGCSATSSIYNPKVRWQSNKGHGHLEEILIGLDGTIYVPDYVGCAAIDSFSGTRKWYFEAINATSGIALSNRGDTLYVCDMDYLIHAVDTSSSKTKWSFQISNISLDPTIGPDDTIYIGTNGNIFYALNPAGEQLWTFRTDGIEIFYNSRVVEIKGDIRHNPAISKKGIIYFGSLDHKIYALDLAGNKLWAQDVSFPIYTAVSIGDDGTLFCGSGSEDGFIAALTPQGKLKWSFDLEQTFFGSLAIGKDNTIYIGTFEGDIFAIDAQGKIKWVFETKGSFTYGVTLTVDNIIYASNSNGTLYALRADGSLYWSLALNDELSSSPTIGIDGTIYVASVNDKVFAIESGG